MRLVKYTNSWSDFQIGQIQYIWNKIMIIANILDAQYQQYNQSIHKIFPEEIAICYQNWTKPLE